MYADNFNPQAKTYYRPIDAALRWCGLMQYEAEILQAAWHCPGTLGTLFPQWPCLHANTERIYDAIRNGELPYGYFGISVPMGSPMEPDQITVRHTDLRLWMQRHYPDQRPDFLFESVNSTREQISPSAYLSLRVERDTFAQECTNLHRQLTDLQTLGQEQRPLSERSEHTLLQIIGALIYTVLDSSPAGKPLSVLANQTAIVDAITSRFSDIPGLSKRTLDAKFAAANRILKKAT